MVGLVASLLGNQLEDTNRGGSHESSTDKLGDFCKHSRCSELEGNVMSPPLREFAATGRSEHFHQQSLGYFSSFFFFFLCLPFPLKNAALPKCHGGF